MKRFLLPAFLLCAAAISAEELTVHPARLQWGATQPQVVSDALGDAVRFRATAVDAAAARLPGACDFRQGAKIQLEFQDDRLQTNTFPRLLEMGSISLHFQVEPQDTSGGKRLKLLFTGKGKDNFRAVQIPLPYTPDTWHRAEIVIDAANRMGSLQLDGGAPQLTPLPEGIKLDQLNAILGASSLKQSNRGFNGAIRNLKITTPFAGGLQAPSPSPVTPGVRHQLISAVKGRHLAFPGIAQLPGGELAAVFREGEGHVCPYGRICVVYSKDGGKNWSAPVAVADTATDERDPSIQTLPDGRVLLTHGGWNSWMYYGSTGDRFTQATNYIKQSGPEKFGGSHYLFSSDGGKTFDKPIRVPAFAPHGPAVAADGTLYQPTLGNDHGKRQVYFRRGTPDAKNWDPPVLIGESAADGNVTPNYEEPHTAVLPDGTLITAIRVVSDGYMRVSFSKDQGKSWSEPVKTPVRGYPQHLLPLKDGRLLATYGYRFHPMGVRACLSRDGGKTWDIKNEIILRNNGKNEDLGYPVSIERPDGEVLTVYYFVDTEHDNCYIEGAFYRP